MPDPYIGPGWEHPERRKMNIGGSTADFYIHDGFTVAVIVEAGFVDQERVKAGRDIAVFSPVDEIRSTPMTWVRDLDEAEKFIAAERAQHPDWPTVPVPLAFLVPRLKDPEKARDAVREIVAVLEAREDLMLRGYNVWRMAILLFTVCQHMFINQESIDYAKQVDEVRTKLLEGMA